MVSYPRNGRSSRSKRRAAVGAGGAGSSAHADQGGPLLWMSLGSHVLKGIAKPVNLVQGLCHRFRNRKFPPINTITEATRQQAERDRLILLSRGSVVPPPTGLLALVFTDVQDSTEFWDTNAEVMARSLDLHNSLLRGIIDRFNGYEVKTEGDAFMIAFQNPVDAIRWCLTSQEALLDAAWDIDLLSTLSARVDPKPPRPPLWRGLRVRMGIGFGEPLARQDPGTSICLLSVIFILFFLRSLSLSPPFSPLA